MGFLQGQKYELFFLKNKRDPFTESRLSVTGGHPGFRILPSMSPVSDTCPFSSVPVAGSIIGAA
jgi:hypothetical protein